MRWTCPWRFLTLEKSLSTGLLWFSLAASATCSPLLAQENFGAPEDNNDVHVVVSYGSTKAHVDGTAVLSFYLTAPYEVGAVDSELRLPKAAMVFDKVRKSDILGASSSATIETSVADDP